MKSLKEIRQNLKEIRQQLNELAGKPPGGLPPGDSEVGSGGGGLEDNHNAAVSMAASNLGPEKSINHLHNRNDSVGETLRKLGTMTTLIHVPKGHPKIPEGHAIKVETHALDGKTTVTLVKHGKKWGNEEGGEVLTLHPATLKPLKDDPLEKPLIKQKKIDEQVLSRIVNRIFNRSY